MEQIVALLQAVSGDWLGFTDGLTYRVHQLHDPRFACAQVSPPIPLSALGELIVSLLNNSSAVYEMGPASAALERFTVEWLSEKIGYPPEAGGLLTNGGSVGNLTALLSARQIKAGYDLWEEGFRADKRFTVLVSEQAHYCVARATQVMGWGAAGATLVETDAEYRVTEAGLEQAYRSALEAGLTPIAVAASACTTSTGSYDPLPVVADFCASRQLWMHVDGAHGVPAILSPSLRDRLVGLERADSVVVDLHKMMALPLTTTAVLYRQGADAYRAFDQKASYLFGEDKEKPWFQGGMRTLECSKRNMGFAFWLTLGVYGEGLFRDYVERTHLLAQRFAQRLEERPEFELVLAPQSNIVCFRSRGFSESDLGKLRWEVNRSGQASIGTTRLKDGLALRAVFMNPLTTFLEIESLLDLVAAQAEQRAPS